MKSFLISAALCTACSATEFHRAPVAMETARKSPQPYSGNEVKQENVEAKSGSVNSAMPKPVPQAPHSEEVVQPPAKISGTFLSCQHLMKPSAQFAYIGCQFQNEAGFKVDIFPDSVSIAVTGSAAYASSYQLRLASSSQSKMSAWIDIESTDGRVSDITKDLRVSVRNLNPFQSVADLSRPLSEVLNPVFANPAPDWQRVCDPNGSCTALNVGSGIFWSDVLTVQDTFAASGDWCASKGIAGLKWRVPSLNEVRIANEHNITETPFAAELNQAVLGRVWGSSINGAPFLVEAEGAFAFVPPNAATQIARVICVAQ